VKLKDENSALRERVARVKADEIKAEAERTFDEHKSRWEKEEKIKEVGKEAQRILRDFIGILKVLEPHHFAKTSLSLGCQTWSMEWCHLRLNKGWTKNSTGELNRSRKGKP
jgi:benzoyl-CoA reductase/2-hydroxyglutaryl-CoA dehydratase subunit BcrC/BadD/HgdB